MKHTFEIKSASIIRGPYKDIIVLRIFGGCPFPDAAKELEMEIDPKLEIKTKAGYAEEWLKSNGIFCETKILENKDD